MCFAAGWNGFAGRIWPVSRSLENPDVNYEDKWWQHTPLLESNTNAEPLWFNLADTDKIFWAEIQLFDGQQEAPINTVLPQHFPKLYTRNPAIYFPEVDKTCVYIFGRLPGFLETLIESGNLFCSATGATKPALGIILLWFNYIALFFNDLGIHSSWEAKQRDTPLVDAFTPVYLVLGMRMITLPIFRWPFKTPWHLTHTSQPNHSAF